MSKKITKTEYAQFKLEPDGFSIHKLELSRKLTAHEWKTCKDRFYKAQKQRTKGEATWIYKVSQHRHYISRYEANGIQITLESIILDGVPNGYYIRIMINPRRLIDPSSSYLGILPPKRESVKTMCEAFAKLFEGTSIESDFDQYDLRRVDLCANLRCDHEKIFRETVRVLRKLPTPPKYERRLHTCKDKKAENQYNKHYLRFVCSSQQLVIYDKTFQMEQQRLKMAYENLSEGVLRFEVQYQRNKLRRMEKEWKTASPSVLLRKLIKESQERIIKHFSTCFGEVDFCQMEEIKRRIMDSRFKKEDKEAMVKLSELMQRKQSVDAAAQEMGLSAEGLKKLMKCFRKLEISPVPLWKNFCAPYIPGPVELLRGAADGAVEIAYADIKYR